MNGDLQINQLTIEEKPWESKHIGLPVYKVNLELQPKTKKYHYTLVDSSKTKLINYLINDGYELLIPTVDLELKTADINYQYNATNIREATEHDLNQLWELAGNSFTQSRLHCMAGNHIADLMHGDWIANCLNKSQADHVLVYHEYSIIYGFIAIKEENSIGNIVLIAVDNLKRGQGIGKRLVMYACDLLKETTTKVKVRTELPNISAIRMYESCGFRFVNGSIYLGKVIE